MTDEHVIHPTFERSCAPCEIPRSHERLHLAPMDSDARQALHRTLQSIECAFDDKGALIVLSDVDRSTGDILAQLRAGLNDALQYRIKGVFTAGCHSPEEMLSAVLRAESLAELFAQQEVQWAHDVLDQDRLFSVFHPIISAADGSIFAHEALIRAIHPRTDEIIGAAHLIYACDRLHMQHVFDQKARITAIRDAAKHQLFGSHLFVNFVPSTIHDPEVCLQSTMDAVADCGWPIDQLVFEVIETERIPSTARLREVADYYRRMGAGIALDDISSGFASLQYLADLMPDYAKVDRILVESCAASASARHTLDSIVTLSQKLGVKVVAEGIETREQMQICVEAGVDYLQGFLFAVPAAPPEPVNLAPFHPLRLAV